MSHFLVAAPMLLCACLPLSLNAEVADADINGFTVRHTINIAAVREDVYRAAVHDVGKWWSDDHTMSGVAANMSIDARPLGCFCETLGDGAGVVHMTVTFVNPLVMIKLTGGLGPLGLMGVDGNMTWEFDDGEAGTDVTLNYAVGGYMDGGLNSIASSVDAVLVEQMSRLKAFVEAGSGDE
ncbi:MAG: ATPase [Gammaproteobacteria bacterium]|nr:ATPase [Gammaproteobacteria bacterium]MDH4313643.1 ATPase [Gammaproteobacteria bacterium]MDH5213856.1 ATPase [Gammaproteobacteria bacterium]MDH5500373.1 ATPase [Gammaproteobacteria bacterium]